MSVSSSSGSAGVAGVLAGVVLAGGDKAGVNADGMDDENCCCGWSCCCVVG